MNDESIIRVSLDELRQHSQAMRLRCLCCGRIGDYDVGVVFMDPRTTGSLQEITPQFSKYFRCSHCSRGGPWEVENQQVLQDLLTRKQKEPNFEGVALGKYQLFDGTQTMNPAMSEDYLRAMIAKNPTDAFLHTRLGNLLRSCGFQDQSAECYTTALALDPGDIEARYHLFSFAVSEMQMEQACFHCRRLARALLEGRTTNRPELTEGIAYYLIDQIRSAPEEFSRNFFASLSSGCESKEDIFIRDTLIRTGDEDRIADEEVNRLLGMDLSITESTSTIIENMKATSLTNLSGNPGYDPVPTLKESLMLIGSPENYRVAFEASDRGNMRVVDKHVIQVSDGAKMAPWAAESLTALFRGNRPAPPDIEQYPEEYAPHFWFIEKHVLAVSDSIGDRTDQEMEEIYAALRRRPEGRSLGTLHDLMWQAMAVLLGTFPLSESEYEGILGALVRSTRKWSQRPVSRNYVAFLRNPSDFMRDEDNRWL